MRTLRMPRPGRALLLAVLTLIGGTACEQDATGESLILGTWDAQVGSGNQRTEFRLEITPSRYTWTESSYGPGGRPEDGLRERMVRGGDWDIRGDRLAMHVESLGRWSHPAGWLIVDFEPSWDETSRLAVLTGDRMTIEHRPPPYQSYVRPTLEFRRVR
jgi:hypothetical protein